MPLVDVLLDGTTDSIGFICSRILKDSNYYRLQIELHGASDDLDNASQVNVQNLSNLAAAYLTETGESIIENIAAKLNS